MENPVPPPVPENTPQPPSDLESTTPQWDPPTRTWILGLHLSGLLGLAVPYLGNIVAPLIIWNLKKEEIPALDEIGKNVLNFQITYSIALVIASLLCFVCVGMVLVPLFAIIWLVLMIVAAVKASNGENYRYPGTFTFLK